MPWRFFIIGLSLFSLSACIPSPRSDLNRPSAKSVSQCMARLQNRNVRFSINEGIQRSNGCSTKNTIILEQFGIKASNLGPMTCTLASKFVNWSNGNVNLAAVKVFGSGLARIETFGTYSCRRINGTNNLSEHAFSNAIDVSAFVLKNGKRISVLKGWRGSRDEQRFLRTIRNDACRQFGTTLSPDFNEAHKDHFHLDDAQRNSGGFCR